MNKRYKLSIQLIALAFLLPACGGEQVAPATPDYFIPPTLSSLPTPLALHTPTAPPVSPTPPCTYSLSFLEDITVPDGTKFAPGAPIDKIWLVRNNGTCNWDARFQLRFLDGDLMQAESQIGLFPARAGAEAQIQVQFIAPDEVGTYASRWQAYTPLGDPFGDLIFILIEVDPALAPTSTPEPEATPDDATPEG